MRRPLVFCGLLFSVLLLFLLWLHPLWWGEEQKLSEETAYFEGVLYEKEYRIRSEKSVQVLYLKDVYIYDVMPRFCGGEGESLPKRIPYKIMCYMKSEDPDVRLGSRLLVGGKIRNFRSAVNEGEFDSARYYQILGLGTSLQECVIAAQYGQGSILKSRLYCVKEYAGLLLHAVLNEEDASILGSLLLGESALLDKDTKNLYKRSGIIHILAISGLHVSLLGMGTFRLLKKCGVPLGLGVGLASAVVILFGWMTGFGPSSMRAVIMFLLQMAAYFAGRTYDLPTGLSLAAITVLSIQPLYLYHSGFMLSFLSVASLVVLQPLFADIFPGKIAPGLTVFVGTLPVHAWFYYEAAPYAVLLNLLVIPCMPVLMLLGGCLLLFSTVWMPLAAFPAKGIHLLLLFYGWISDASLKIPGHSWVIGKPAVYQMILYLTVLVIAVFAGAHMPKLWGGMMIGLAVLLLTSDFHIGLQISALDVGQGDCFFVTDHRGISILVDGGSSSKKSVGEYQIEPVLKYHGTQRLDAVFVSHLDSDHYNGILELIEKSDEGGVEIGRIFVTEETLTGARLSGSGISKTEEKILELAGLAAAHDISVDIMPQGSVYRRGKLDMLCLYPPRGKESGMTDDTNENSMVLFLRYGDFTALFTGDLEGKSEDLVAESCQKLLGGRSLTVLKVAHHGSKNSTSAKFLEMLRPGIALISAGENNSYGHPHAETLSRLEEIGAHVFRTDECGEIIVRVRGRKVEVEGYVK